MTDELQARVKQLEMELKAKETSFAEAVEKERQRGREREQRDAKKRDELNAKVLALTEERGQLKIQLNTLRDAEEESARTEEQLKTARRDLVDLKVRAAEGKKNLEEQLADQRRKAEKLKQEVSDLKCQRSILEHKFSHSSTKLQQQDSTAEELARARDQLKDAQEELDSTQRALKTEQLRFQRDRRALEEKAESLAAELRLAREGPSKTDIAAGYEAKLERLGNVLRRALKAAGQRPGEPAVPENPLDFEAVGVFLDHCEELASGQNTPRRSHTANDLGAIVHTDPTKSPSSHKLKRGHSAGGLHDAAFDTRSAATGHEATLLGPDDAFAPEPRELFADLRAALLDLAPETQATLLRRYHATALGNATNRFASFGEASGFPRVTDPPATLVNTIAVVTTQRDKLQAKVDKLERQLEAARLGEDTTPDNKKAKKKDGERSPSPDKPSPKLRASAPVLRAAGGAPGTIGSGLRRSGGASP